MKRTTIMSHGRLHNAKGVRGTHLKGTVPESKVLDAIPATANTVGNIPETARPGKVGEVTRDAGAPAPVRTTKFRMDEGVPVLPGGNRDYGHGGQGLGTSRPQLDDVSAPVPTRTSSGQVPAPISTHDDVTESGIRRAVAADEAAAPDAATRRVPEPVAPPPEPTPVVEQDELEEDAPSTLSAPLPTTKRKLTRAKNVLLLEWCAHLGIDPNEYVEEDEAVTGTLLRELIAEAQEIDLG